jgi:hypothetical protein
LSVITQRHDLGALVESRAVGQLSVSSRACIDSSPLIAGSPALAGLHGRAMLRTLIDFDTEHKAGTQGVPATAIRLTARVMLERRRRVADAAILAADEVAA